MKIEICTNSYESAINAEKAGADRIELCAELGVGGITPSYGLAKLVIEKLKIPVFVLLRPRSGDFVYSDTEFEVLKQDLVLMKELGCSGIVSGVLNPDFTIDIARTAVLVELAKPLPFTFHRAFDWVINPIDALHQLESIGVHRILTSGQEQNVTLGFELLKKLKNKAKNIIVMPGGGVNSANIGELMGTGFSEVHFSGVSFQERNFNRQELSFVGNNFLNETTLAVSNRLKIKELIDSVK